MIYCAFVLVTFLTYFHPGLHGLKTCASCSIIFHCSAVSAEWKKKKAGYKPYSATIANWPRTRNGTTDRSGPTDLTSQLGGSLVKMWGIAKGRSGPNKKSFKGSVRLICAQYGTLYVFTCIIYIYIYRDIWNCMWYLKFMSMEKPRIRWKKTNPIIWDDSTCFFELSGGARPNFGSWKLSSINRHHVTSRKKGTVFEGQSSVFQETSLVWMRSNSIGVLLSKVVPTKPLPTSYKEIPFGTG